MIACKTLISKGAGPKEGDAHSHGYSLFDDEISAARKAMGWKAAPFEMPDDIGLIDVPELVVREAKIVKTSEGSKADGVVGYSELH